MLQMSMIFKNPRDEKNSPANVAWKLDNRLGACVGGYFYKSTAEDFLSS